MTTNNLLFKRWLKAIFLLCALALALAACGPGTGGTGTGPIHFSGAASFVTTASAQALNVAASDTAQKCAGASGQAIHLLLQQNKIELSSPCGTFSFAGDWVISTAGEAEIVGVWQSSPAIQAVASHPSPAFAKLSFLGAPETSPTVKLILQDTAGQILIGPVDLLRKP